MFAAVLIAALSFQSPSLEVRAGEAWRPWRDALPNSAATHERLLDEAVTWKDSAAGLRRGEFEVRTASGYLRNSMAIIELDPARVRFSLGITPPGARRAAAEWLASDSSLILTSNTGLFRENGTPQGLVLLEGRRHSALAGWLDAVVVIEDGAVRITDVEGARGSRLSPLASAFQTLPWLIRDGRVVFGHTSGLRLSRTHRDRRITLCLDPNGTVRLLLSNFEMFGTSAGTVPIGLTIPEQAALAAGAGCRDAVALDGGISAQIALRAGARTVKMPGWRKVPLMLLARRR
jgi:exopolysaccharide biosynthesis protein